MRFHILTDRISPYHSGGLENSILRIAKILQEMGNEIFVYITDEIEERDLINPYNICYVSLYESIEELLEPIEEIYKRNNLYFRSIYQIMQNRLSCHDINKDEDVLLSFYISSYGFVQQRLADSLNLKHIAFVRGSDYSMDMHIPRKMSCIQYVCNNCSLIVTTNSEQINNLSRVFDIGIEKFRLCYNPVSNVNKQRIQADKEKPLFITDAGYSWKKGTHILFKSFEMLYKKTEGKCRLYICGPTTSSERNYWDRVRARLKDTYQQDIIMDDYNYNFEAMYSQASAYVFPSLAEGCSNALLKSLSQDIPVITTETGTMPELKDVLPGVSCVKPADADELFHAMFDVIESPVCGSYDARIKMISDLFSEERERETLKKIVDTI